MSDSSGSGGSTGRDATNAVNWLMAKVIEAIEDGDPPPA